MGEAGEVQGEAVGRTAEGLLWEDSQPASVGLCLLGAEGWPWAGKTLPLASSTALYPDALGV